MRRHCPINPDGVAQVPSSVISPLKCRDEPIFSCNIDVASIAVQVPCATNIEPDGGNAPKLVAHGLGAPNFLETSDGNRIDTRQHRPGRRVSPPCQSQHFCWKGSESGRHDRRTWGCNRLIFSLTGHDGRAPTRERENKPVRLQCECTSSTSEAVVLGRAGPDLAVCAPGSGCARVSRGWIRRRRVRNRGSDRGKIPDQPYMHETLKRRNISLWGRVPPATHPCSILNLRPMGNYGVCQW